MELEDLTELPHPSRSEIPVSLSGPPVSPAKRLFLYEDGEWEEFIHEWAFSVTADYVSIRRYGGAGDKGVDIAAFTDADGFQGKWDSFQAKHYSRPLSPGDAYPEMLKLFVHAAEGEYTLPRRYYFVAPRGCGTSLARLLKDHDKLKKAFSNWAKKPDQGFSAERVQTAMLLAESTDFQLFCDLSALELLETHRQSQFHVARFGGPLPPRKPVDAPPEQVQESELRYVEQLAAVYDTEWPSAGITAANVSVNEKSAKQFLRQRVRFYSAEALRRYARDSVPDGTFEKLQLDLLEGVIDIADSSHESPLTRLNAVLQSAGQLDLSAHALISVATQHDRRGICHQLANSESLSWMDMDQ
ncbi:MULTISPECIES: ABC-three component system protein [unclassified Plantibacter]|uniref:ABC-three component system protein n=1 Tax=unclassified Plantibacter TaxID=2624265 RepID=UPI000B10977B|nr:MULTISPECIES: ABC-three component system protein [unclassified Plantibacter]